MVLYIWPTPQALLRKYRGREEALLGKIERKHTEGTREHAKAAASQKTFKTSSKKNYFFFYKYENRKKLPFYKFLEFKILNSRVSTNQSRHLLMIIFINRRERRRSSASRSGTGSSGETGGRRTRRRTRSGERKKWRKILTPGKVGCDCGRRMRERRKRLYRRAPM